MAAFHPFLPLECEWQLSTHSCHVRNRQTFGNQTGDETSLGQR
jgi:hypothetical protein